VVRSAWLSDEELEAMTQRDLLTYFGSDESVASLGALVEDRRVG
jgi:hypothetical protein